MIISVALGICTAVGAWTIGLKLSKIRFERERSHFSWTVYFGRALSVTLRERFDYDIDPRFRSGRTRTQGWQLLLSFGLTLDIETFGKSYLELVNGPKYLKDIDWIIDEFDSSFNDLAIASLRYHLGYSVADREARREIYEDLINRLGEARPTYTDEEMAVFAKARQLYGDDFQPVYREDGTIARHTRRRSSPEERAVSEARHQREVEYDARIQQARKDFVDIMPQLWS
jgi:hypothetical protein